MVCQKKIVESVPEAIDAAIENAIFNKIENTSFEVGDMKDCFNDEFVERHGKADVVITSVPKEIKTMCLLRLPITLLTIRLRKK